MSVPGNATPRHATHQTPEEALRLLLRLRVQGFLRTGAAGRVGSRGQAGIRPWVRYVALVVVTVLVAFYGASLLSNVVSGAVGRLLLGALLIWASTAATVMLFLLALPTVLAAFTYNSDLKLLLLTPISPWLLMVEKFVSLYLQLVPYILLVGIPVLLGVGQTLDLGAGYSLATIVALLILPVVPLSLAMLVLLVVLRSVPPRMARSITAAFGTLLGLIFYVGVQLLHSGGGKVQTNVQGMFLQAQQAWWNSLPTAWVGQGLAAAAAGQTGSAISYLVAAIVLGVLLAAVVVLLSARLFASGWATYQEAGRRGRGATEQAIANRTADQTGLGAVLPDRIVERPVVDEASPAMSQPRGAMFQPRGAVAQSGGAVNLAQIWRPWLRKEWLSVQRDPALWTRLAYGLVVVAFGLYRALSQGAGGGVATGPRTGSVTFFITLGFASYFLALFLASRLVNREGRALYLLALAPPSSRAILLIKAAFCAVPSLVIVDGVLVVGGVALHLGIWEMLLSSAVFAMLICALTAGVLLIGLSWPRLDWDNPSRQVSGQASLYGTFGALLLTTGVVALLLLTLTASGPLPPAIYTVGIFVLTALIIGVVVVQAPRRFDALLTGER